MGTVTVDFKSLHDQFRSRVLRYVARWVGEADAEDVTQAVMLKLNEGLARFRGDSDVSTWIYRIATNAAIDKLRGKRIQTVSEAELESDGDNVPVPPAAQITSVETAAIREEMSACITDFVSRLPENYRAVMILSDLEGFKNDEIASILGLSLNTVKIRLHRAREKLRKELEIGCNFYRDECGELACDREPITAITFRPRK
ncbi:MAG TPA: sigma-70 family RNA polymerase sigma factor [Burkholderiales bacterium]|nr:sigma-70 family RNA polymerase sigma factor [Burkholderiales bacterium]